MLRLVKPHGQIYLFLGDTAAELGRPFMRLQEFYESPSKKFRRRFFTVDEFNRWYCRTQSETGKFTYFRDFYGYNVPGTVAEAFFCLYSDHLTSDEILLLKMLGNPAGKYYVIGSPADSAGTIDHELSHAFWHIFPGYREAMLSKQSGWDLSAIRRYLKGNMYSPDMYDDEVTSYVMFDDALLHRSGISTKHLKKLKWAMLALYDLYKKEHVRL